MYPAPRQFRAVAETEAAIAAAYNEAGYRYGKYADGSARNLFRFEGRHAYSDRKSWEVIESRLLTLRARGVNHLKILDIGCGPGTWLRRAVVRARQLGVTGLTPTGLDIADAQIHRARTLSREVAALEGVNLTFAHGDLRGKLPQQAFDLCLCLYGVMNHVPAPEMAAAFARLAEASGGWLVCTVRAIGSIPTVYVDDVSVASRFYQDNHADRLDVEFANGRRARFPSHLFSRAELLRLASARWEVEDVCGLDLFHGRFDNDPRWNAQAAIPTRLTQELDRLEDRYCRDPGFMDRATHLLLTARKPGVVR